MCGTGFRVRMRNDPHSWWRSVSAVTIPTRVFSSTSANPTNFGADASRTISCVVNNGTLNSSAASMSPRRFLATTSTFASSSDGSSNTNILHRNVMLREFVN